MSAIITNLDGDYIFVAAEASATGNQVVLKAARSDLSTWAEVYAPAAGSACNVAQSGDSNIVYFYGNFGTDVVVIKHTVDAETNTDISPASLGAQIVNTMEADPSTTDNLVITVNTAQDLVASTDGGSNWSTWNAALGFNATALKMLWSGDYDLHRLFVAGDNLTDLDLLYSPNEGANTINMENAGLGAQANICSIDVVKVT